MGVGATALLARSIGAGDRESLTFHVRQALVLSVGVGMLFGLLSLVFGRQMLVLMGADAESLAGAQVFFYWVGGLTIFQSLMTILGTILRASGEWERTRLVKKEFVNNSSFLVVDLKQSIPRLFHSHPPHSSNCLGDSLRLEIKRTLFATIVMVRFGVLSTNKSANQPLR